MGADGERSCRIELKSSGAAATTRQRSDTPVNGAFTVTGEKKSTSSKASRKNKYNVSCFWLDGAQKMHQSLQLKFYILFNFL